MVQNAPGLIFLPTTLNQSLYSAFVQDEIALGKDLSLTVGSKIEHNDYTGFEVEPNARLSWMLDSSQALWGAVSRAVRTPSRINRRQRLDAGGRPVYNRSVWLARFPGDAHEC